MAVIIRGICLQVYERIHCGERTLMCILLVADTAVIILVELSAD